MGKTEIEGTITSYRIQQHNSYNTKSLFGVIMFLRNVILAEVKDETEIESTIIHARSTTQQL